MILLPETTKLTRVPPDAGIYTDVPAPVYHSWRAASQSLLSVIHSRTLAHAHEYMQGAYEPTEAMNFGSAYHAMVLEPGLFEKHYHIWSGKPRNTKEGKGDYEAALAVVGGDEGRLVRQGDLAEMRAMHTALRRETRTRKLVCVAGSFEACIVWRDEPTGMMCKARLDKLLPEPFDIILDLKAVRSASPVDFAKSAADYGYDIQAGFYTDGVKAATGRDCRFFFIPQEKEAPYLSSVVDATDERHQPMAAEVGRHKYRQALERLADALASDRWPGYGDEPHALALPVWAVPQEMTT